MMNNFNVEYQGLVHNFESYFDFEFIDNDPKHLYQVTYDTSTDSWYGMMRTSKYSNSGFDHEERYLTEEELTYCRSLIPDHDLKLVNDAEAIKAKFMV
jgi:hypothetical protein